MNRNRHAPDRPRIANEKGEIGVQYYQPVPKQILLRNNHGYSFHVQRNVSMAWILPEDVDAVLALPYGCCGHQKVGAFFLASQMSIDVFLGNDVGERR